MENESLKLKPKFWLDSRTVRSILKMAAAPLIGLLGLAGVDIGGEKVMQGIEYIADLVSLWGVIEGLVHRNSKAPLSLTKPPQEEI